MKWCPEFIVWALLALWLTPSCGSEGCWGSDEPTPAVEAKKPAEKPIAQEETEVVPAKAVEARKPAEKPIVREETEVVPAKVEPEPTVRLQPRSATAKATPEKPKTSVARSMAVPRDQDKSKAKRKPAAQPKAQDEDFADNAFPPTLSDTKQHRKAWRRNDCLRCHETGVGEAPEVRHKGMPDLLKVAKCRSCHVFEPGKKPTRKKRPPIDAGFADFAFPPMIPASAVHRKAWRKDDCLLCHEDGLMGAPKVRHKGLPPLTLKAKCRTCHVQVRVLDSDPKRH